MIHFSERLKLVNDTIHRVCEKILDLAGNYWEEETKTITMEDLEEILDQIEKGE